MNTQDIQDMIMSYVVELDKIRPKWFRNAFRDSFAKSIAQAMPAARPKKAGQEMTESDWRHYYWNHEYPDYVYKDDDFGETVTFPDEQSYVWFVLRWS